MKIEQRFKNILLENNFSDIHRIFEYFHSQTYNSIKEFSGKNLNDFSKIDPPRYIITCPYKKDIEYNLLASIFFFISLIHLIFAVFKMLESGDGNQKDFDKKTFPEKLNALCGAVPQLNEVKNHLININNIYRNRFLHITHLNVTEIEGFSLPQPNEINSPHSAFFLIFYPEEILDCLKLFKRTFSILKNDNNMKFAYKFCESGLTHINEKELRKLHSYYIRNNLQRFLEKTYELCEFEDYNKDYIRKEHRIEIGTGASDQNRITGRKLKCYR